jgi:hypothetical protein
MIFAWLVAAIRRIVWFLKLPKPEDLAFVDPKQKCPCCGFQKRFLDGEQPSSIRCIVLEATIQSSNRQIQKRREVHCQHTCGRCGCRWFDDPIQKADTRRLYPGIARTELEKAEDHEKVRFEQVEPS